MSILDRLLGLMDPTEAADRFTPDLAFSGEAMASARQQASEGFGQAAEQQVLNQITGQTFRSAPSDNLGVPANMRLAAGTATDIARGDAISNAISQWRLANEQAKMEGRTRLEGHQIGAQDLENQTNMMHTQMEAQAEFGNRAAKRQFVSGVFQTAAGVGTAALMRPPEFDYDRFVDAMRGGATGQPMQQSAGHNPFFDVAGDPGGLFQNRFGDFYG